MHIHNVITLISRRKKLFSLSLSFSLSPSLPLPLSLAKKTICWNNIRLISSLFGRQAESNEKIQPFFAAFQTNTRSGGIREIAENLDYGLLGKRLLPWIQERSRGKPGRGEERREVGRQESS